MWALVESGSVTKIYTRPKAITAGDVNYPSNIFMLWSSSELEAIGIYEVVIDNSNFKDQEYYINTNQTFAFADGVVTASYGTATAKTLADLKTNHKTVVNELGALVLTLTDWMVVRAAEGGTAVPSSITTKRAAVRTKANAMCTAIDNAANVDALAALYVYNDATPPVKPLGDFPILGA